jgi:hypothetical protein
MAAAALPAAVLLALAPADEGRGAAPGPPAELRLSLRSTGLVQRELGQLPAGAEREAGAGLWRLRLDGSARPLPDLSLAGAWETRLRVDSGGATEAGLGILPATVPAPFRLRQLDWSIAGGTGLSWRHEVDRAAAELQLGAFRAAAGRQAIGWGRGVLFGAVDLFAPFAPLEVDREWRRGVDALRAELELSRRAAAEVVVAAAERASDMATLARLRGAFGDADAELVGGWRAGDWVGGVSASGAAGDAELHGEVAAFRSRDPLPAGGSLGDARLAVKAVLGASSRFALGKGLYLLAEAHYSGFGARSPGALAALAADPAFARRLLRGDTQIAGRQAAALLSSYEVTEVTTASVAAVVSPRDGSGVAAPSLRFDLSDRLTVTAQVFLSWGTRSSAGLPRSDFGGTPLAALVQMALYQ